MIFAMTFDDFSDQIRAAWKARDGAAALALLDKIEREAERLADLSTTQEKSQSALWLLEGDRSAQSALDLVGLSIRAADVARACGQAPDADRRWLWCATIRAKLGVE